MAMNAATSPATIRVTDGCGVGSIGLPIPVCVTSSRLIFASSHCLGLQLLAVPRTDRVVSNVDASSVDGYNHIAAAYNECQWVGFLVDQRILCCWTLLLLQHRPASDATLPAA